MKENRGGGVEQSLASTQCLLGRQCSVSSVLSVSPCVTPCHRVSPCVSCLAPARGVLVARGVCGAALQLPSLPLALAAGLFLLQSGLFSFPQSLSQPGAGGEAVAGPAAPTVSMGTAWGSFV